VQKSQSEGVLDAARRYAGMGWSIIPMLPGTKKPAISTWREHQQRRASHEEIAEWFAIDGYGIAVITGAISGIVVIDGDRHHGNGIRVLERKYGAFCRPTRMHITPSNGVHLIYEHPGVKVPNSHGAIGWLGEPDIDVKGDGGYVVLPPTPGYRVARDIRPAHCPAWVRPKPRKAMPILPPAPVSRGSGTPYGRQAMANALRRLTGTPNGSRNHELNREAFGLGQLIASGQLQEGEVRQRLYGTARAIGLEAEEVRKTLESGISAGMLQPFQPRPHIGTYTPISEWLRDST
jgi:hypothetical protein